MFDPNEFTVNSDGYLEITMHNKDHDVSGVAIVDTRHYDTVIKHKWALSCGYAVCKVNGKNVYLHRMIAGFPDNMVVDHINHNTLDNRECNLRTCTHQENLCNHSGSSRNKSGIKGVSWDKRAKRWKMQIRYNGKTISKSFLDINDAATARREAEIKYYGVFGHNVI